MKELSPPFDGALLLRHAKRLKRENGSNPSATPIRILFLGGWTTQETGTLLDLMLGSMGIQAEIQHSEYGAFYEEAVLDSSRLERFKPQFVFVHTSSLNILSWPPIQATRNDFENCLDREASRFETIWSAVTDKLPCTIIQNNFEVPSDPLGNFGATAFGGRKHFVEHLNQRLTELARGRARKDVVIHDLHGVAARVGSDHWNDPQRWYAYKLAITPDANAMLSYSLARLIGAALGKAKKCLVLDLDNTLWGGVIGDDGLEKIRLGRDTAEGEAHLAFQSYCLAMQQRGVLLAVCSKNEEAAARLGFAHPDSVLKLEHFSAFRANWEPKDKNIISIAKQLNIGLDSLVFVDDNPAERELVRLQLPMVEVPEVGSDVSRYADIVSAGAFFETLSISKEDLARASAYQNNSHREELRAAYASYDEYLSALDMRAEIAPFSSMYFERISQLINKTNQFNLTTLRVTSVEVERMAADPSFVTLYGRLFDRFGDNGLISVVVGHLIGDVLEIDSWLMSCRVLKRGMELAMLDALCQQARTIGAKSLKGTYLRTEKNAMVAQHYEALGFSLVDQRADGAQTNWVLALPTGSYQNKNQHIVVSGAPQ